MLKAVTFFLFIMFSILECITAEDQRRDTQHKSSYKFGLVCSGGGARAGAHVGILEVLHENRIPVDIIVGNSFGAVVAGFYASGMNPHDIADLMRATDWDQLFSIDPDRRFLSMRRKDDSRDFLAPYGISFDKNGRAILPLGVVPPQQLLMFLESHSSGAAGVQDFDDFATPFRTIACDFEDGSIVQLAQGSLAEAMYASMAVPGLFPPIVINDKYLVDGGIVENIPVSAARPFHCEEYLVIDVGTPFLTRHEIHSYFKVFSQMLTVLTRGNVEKTIKDLRENEILIQPVLENVSTRDYSGISRAIQSGREAGMKVLPRLMKYQLSQEDWDAFLAKRASKKQAPRPRIHSIEITSNDEKSKEGLDKYLLTQPGDRIDLDVLQQDLMRIYQLGVYDSVTYQVEKKAHDEIDLEIYAHSKASRRGRIRLGLLLEDDFDGQGSYTLAGEFTRFGLNPLGGELKIKASAGKRQELGADWYQPLTAQDTWFVRPYVGWNEDDLEVNGQSAGLGFRFQYRLERQVAGVDVGRNIGKSLRINGAYEIGKGKAEVEFGLSAPALNFDVGQIRLEALYDYMNYAHFPSDGQSAEIIWRAEEENLGSSEDYRSFEAEISIARSIGKHSLYFHGNIGTTYEGESVASLYQLGGFLNLSGYTSGQLLGSHSALALASWYYQFGGKRNIGGLGFPLFVGMSLEQGQVFTDEIEALSSNSITAGSLWLGIETPVGPAFLAMGAAEGGQRSAYLYFGNPF